MRAAVALLFVGLSAACGGGASPSGPGPWDAAVSESSVDAATDAASLEDAGQPPVPDASVDAAADAAVGLGPPYPIVLAHGFFGFDDIGPIDYFWHVAETLEANGHAVRIAEVTPIGSSEDRAVELAAFVEQVRAETGRARVNLIGHSQGGLDARIVAHDFPESVAAVVTVSAPHRGTRVADVLLDLAPGFTEGLANIVFELFGKTFIGDVAEDADVRAALELFSEPGIAAFNARAPDAPGVAYYSIAGRSALRLALDECHFDDRADLVRPWDEELDPRDPFFAIPGAILDAEGPNDGMVTVASARWGTFLGCVPADHMDEVGQLFGDAPGVFNDFDHLAMYRGLADLLVAEGF